MYQEENKAFSKILSYKNNNITYHCDYLLENLKSILSVDEFNLLHDICVAWNIGNKFIKDQISLEQIYKHLIKSYENFEFHLYDKCSIKYKKYTDLLVKRSSLKRNNECSEETSANVELKEEMVKKEEIEQKSSETICEK